MTTDHRRAITLFEEIQARPYSISSNAEQQSNNCFYKGVELLTQLGIMGYTVRGRVAETYWDDHIVPKEIVALLPKDILVTHFFVEIYQDGNWRILDPSFQTPLAAYGFQIGSWEGGESCFPLTKLYTQEQSLAYQEQWFDPAYQKDFFERGGACWRALNTWFQDIASKHE